VIQLCDGAVSQVIEHLAHSSKTADQDSAPYERMAQLVSRIRDDHIDTQAQGLEDLYKLFSQGIRFYLRRHLPPQELDDKVHDAFILVVKAIRQGELREPARLMGFVYAIVRRQVAAHIDKAVHSRMEHVDFDSRAWLKDSRRDPEESILFQERRDLISRVLAEIPVRDREILTRFYLHEQSPEQICSDMELSPTQFRLLKSRAKIRFGELGKKKAARNSWHSLRAYTLAAS